MKILNFGSLNIDFVYYVDNFVKPGETIFSNKQEKFCGGKGLNQSIALKKAGANVYHAGLVGEDGDMLINKLKENGVNTDFIRKASASSGNALIQVDRNGQNCIILSSGTNVMIDEGFVDEVLQKFGSDDFLVLQNEISCMNYIINKASEKGMTIILNPSPFNELLLKYDLSKISIFILNEVEGCDFTHKSNYDDMFEILRNKFPDSKIVLTLGSKGVFYNDGTATYKCPAFLTKTVDTTAAGDAFTGYFVTLLSENMPSEQILQMAQKAASISVSKKGAADSIPLRNEVENCI